MELLAQVVEEISILTAKKYARKEPRKIDRPAWMQGGSGSPKAEQAEGNPFSRAIDRIAGFSPRRQVEGEYTGTPPDHLKAAMS
jgi:hypothetical protein